MTTTRVILYHKHATSARTRFLRLGYDSVCGFAPVPFPAQLMDEVAEEIPLPHPARAIRDAEKDLGLAPGGLEAEGEFRMRLDTVEGPIDVFLARITTIDPPFELAERQGASFIALTEARSLPPYELELLRAAYELIMGG